MKARRRKKTRRDQIVYQDDLITLYCGDALSVLDGLDPGSFAAMVTDPPYASGTRKEAAKGARGENRMLRGHRFSKRPISRDQMTSTGFIWVMREVAYRANELIESGGHFLSFIDWRQWPNLVGAVESVGLRVCNQIVWDKGSMGMGSVFRNQHELILHASKGVPNARHRGTSNVLTCKRDRKTEHQSPKPVELMTRLLVPVASKGEIVVDPFAGSGATLIACRRAGVRCVGIEWVPDNCRMIVERLTAE